MQFGAVADRQRRAVREGRIIVEPTLARSAPIYSSRRLPSSISKPWASPCRFGTAAIPTTMCRFSLVVTYRRTTVALLHYEWLTEGPEDPRPQLAASLIHACASARTVVAYNAGFERRCVEQMATAFPALEPQLLSITARLVDLLPIVRNHIYHPDFLGSFSLKTVLPALVPELSYVGLAIAEGGTASIELERLMFSGDGLDSASTETLRSDLLRYCHQDTRGLAYIHTEFLRQVPVSSRGSSSSSQ